MTLLSDVYDVVHNLRGMAKITRGCRPTLKDFFTCPTPNFDCTPNRCRPGRIVEIDKFIGDEYGGGYIAGVMNADIRYVLIVAPKAAGESLVKWGDGASGAYSTWDGLANTLNLLYYSELPEYGAGYCTELTIGGHSDWYFPAINEVELMYRNLKPTSDVNMTGSWSSYGTTLYSRNGYNPDSDPIGIDYTTESPAQTDLTLFQEGGSEALDGVVWSSTDSEASRAWTMQMVGEWAGSRNRLIKINAFNLRAVRRVII